MNIAIIGTGAFSLSMLSNLNIDSVKIWTDNKTNVTNFKKTKKLDNIIKGVSFPKNTTISIDYQEVLSDADVVLLLTSSDYIENVCIDIAPFINKKTIIMVGTKGLLPGGILIHDQIKHLLPTKRILYMSGPNYSGDLINNDPIGLNIAGDEDVYLQIKNIFKDNVYTEYTEDVDGLLLCGAIKNVFAIGSGILSGLNYGDSTKYFYITRLAKEMRKIIKQVGGYRETMYSLAGIGDLMLTCDMTTSRNYSFGEELAKNKIKDVKKYLKENTVEGYYTLDCINDLFNSKKVNYPIINVLYNIVYNNADPKTLVEALLK